MREKLVWVGPRESDILYSGLNFVRSITFNGSNRDGNTSFTTKISTRINHISGGKQWHLGRFLRENLYPLLADPAVRFVFYNPAQSFGLGEEIEKRTLCVNSKELSNFFRNKANVRAFAQGCIPVVPYVHFTGRTLPDVQFDTFIKNRYILQTVYSSAGEGTHLFSIENCADYVANHSETEEYILSPYLKNASPINVHIVVFERGCIVFPPSFQIISQRDDSFSYVGGDFHTNLSDEQYTLILRYSQALGEKMRNVGYRGVCGIDFMLTKNELYFLEVNTRFQASSFLANKLIKKENKPTLHTLNRMAFDGKDPPLKSFVRFSDPEGFFTISGEQLPGWLKDQDLEFAAPLEIIWDGFAPHMKLTPGAYLCRIVTTKNLCWSSPNDQLYIAPNIQLEPKNWQNKVLSLDPLALKIGLLNQGIRFSPEAKEVIMRKGDIRQGVFQSVDLAFSNGSVINSPYHTKFSDLTPYCIEWNGTDFILSYEGHPLSTITLAPADPYRDRTASGGTRFRDVAFLATDRLRIHHEFRCHFKESGNGCHFCNVKQKTGCFSIADVCEVIDFYLEHMSFRHFLIGGGSGRDADEASNILELVYYIRSKSDKPIYAMCLPPKDLSILSEYHKAGIDEIGFNLELFDRTMAAEIMPGKGQIPLLRYEIAYREAVRLWGRHGNVRSLMVLGLESFDSFYHGVEWLCRLGVMPIVSVFRPMDNIELRHALPPSNEQIEAAFYRGAEIAARYGLMLGPACHACRNNTLSMPL